MAQGSPAAMADRYGRRSGGAPTRPAWLVPAAVLVALGIAWAGWVTFGSARAAVRWQDGTFTALDDGRARLSFSVTTDPGHAAVCTVRMFNAGLTEVGRTDMRVGPARTRTFSVTAVVPTFETAAGGTVRACVPG